MPTVAAEPYEYHFNPSEIALVIIDMQRDFLEPGGFGETLGNDIRRLHPAITPVRRLLDAFRRRGMTVVHTKECHQADLSDCPKAKHRRGKATLRIGDQGPMGRVLIAGEPGNDFIADLQPQSGELVVAKPGKGAFYATNLQSSLAARGITHLLFTGVTTEVCVQTSMREANDRGFECLLVEDGTESYFPEFKRATIDMIRAQGGIVGWTAPAEAILAALES
jgi:biuret amidohydrolase